MFKRTENTLWTEKYRPDSLDTYIGNSDVVDKIHSFIQGNDIPHLLLCGKAGTGKTTLAKIIVNTINCDYLYINASDKGGVDYVRTDIIPFASSAGFNDLKVVILDECLEAGTLVSILRSGKEILIPIELIDDKSDLIKSYNIETGLVEWQPLLLWNKGIADIWQIELENGEIIRCTADHKWYVEDAGSVKVVKTTELHLYSHILSPI